MARIRSLKPDHKSHRKVGPLTDRQYRLWVGMLTEADDEGRLVASADQLRLQVFGYHPLVRAKHIEEALSVLVTVGLIHTYVVGDVRYAQFPSWRDHQVVNKFMRSKIPPPLHSGSATVALPEHSGSAPGVLPEHSGSATVGAEGSGREGSTSKPLRVPRSAPNGGAGFAEFYRQYPRKMAPRAAERAWRAAIKRAPCTVILAGLQRELPRLRQQTLVPYPATWLNGDSWNNEVVAARDDPYANFPHLYDCAECGDAHETRTCTKAPGVRREEEAR